MKLDEIQKRTIVLICLGCILIGMIAGAWIMDKDDFSYKDASVMTCKYANNLTDIVNLQSRTLKSCTGHDYQILEHLNCELLK